MQRVIIGTCDRFKRHRPITFLTFDTVVMITQHTPLKINRRH